VKGWNKMYFSLDARLLLVKHVLSAMTIFQLLVIDTPTWLLKVIDKLRRSFVWNNDEIAAGGKCLVRWSAVCRPLPFGGWDPKPAGQGGGYQGEMVVAELDDIE
jgi:hypothetical protein